MGKLLASKGTKFWHLSRFCYRTPSIFVIYTDDLHQAINIYKVSYFADAINLLCLGNSNK